MISMFLIFPPLTLPFDGLGQILRLCTHFHRAFLKKDKAKSSRFLLPALESYEDRKTPGCLGYIYIYIWVFPKIGVSQNGWFISWKTVSYTSQVRMSEHGLPPLLGGASGPLGP